MSQIGVKTEGIVLSKLIEAGYGVSVTFGSHNPYDLIIDKDGILFKVECRHGRYRNGVILFNTRTKTTKNGKRVSKISKADLFAVYCEQTGKVYLLPVEDFLDGRIRVKPTKNNQNKRIKWAKDYELGTLV